MDETSTLLYMISTDEQTSRLPYWGPLLRTAAGARPNDKNSCVQVWRLSARRLRGWRLSMYDHVRKLSGCFHMNCYFVGANELVSWSGRTSAQKLYLKFGESIGIVCEYQL